MDKTIVGNNAGKVWCALKEIGEISIPELARRLNLSVESTALAAGWLARENKICPLFCKNPLQTFPRCGIIHLAASPLKIEYLPL